MKGVKEAVQRMFRQGVTAREGRKGRQHAARRFRSVSRPILQLRD